ncbi:hypothetical protein TNCV_1260841 [Trichonephila clavipes]|nr:hypothetical protein TNCV_1260841 [Trichonephila clavipes]
MLTYMDILARTVLIITRNMKSVTAILFVVSFIVPFQFISGTSVMEAKHHDYHDHHDHHHHDHHDHHHHDHHDHHHHHGHHH